jgi:hypothetical protein
MLTVQITKPVGRTAGQPDFGTRFEFQQLANNLVKNPRAVASICPHLVKTIEEQDLRAQVRQGKSQELPDREENTSRRPFSLPFELGCLSGARFPQHHHNLLVDQVLRGEEYVFRTPPVGACELPEAAFQNEICQSGISSQPEMLPQEHALGQKSAGNCLPRSRPTGPTIS